MALFTINNVGIRGISAAVPHDREDNNESDLIPEGQKESFIKTTGIRYRRIAQDNVTASDLCFAAATSLIERLEWRREDIDVLVFVTQTPDYLIPNSASILQEKLGLSKNCLAFDVNLGCSGYVYGLSILGSLLQNIPNGKGLLLVGDCSSSVVSRYDRSTYPLFSDAGSATALECASGVTWRFNLQTDGSGYQDIIVRAGGMRNRFSEEAMVLKEYSPGEKRSDLNMKLDGMRIFNFALREVAVNIEALLRSAGISSSEIDYYILHQANKLILDCVRKKLNETEEKFPNSLFYYGNTSSASIPVTIVTELAQKMSNCKMNNLLSGFGVGLSWGSVYLPFENVIIPDLIEL